MKFIFNPLTGAFDQVVSTEADVSDIATTYLKLDASNDPVTGPLVIDGFGAAEVGLTISLAPSQTASGFVITDSSDNVLSGVDERGILFSDGGIGGANIFIGINSGLNAISGMADNVAIGSGALQAANNVAADKNFALGTNSLNALTSGYNNTVIGIDAASNLTTGYRNVILGSTAGVQGTNTRDSVIIGTSAGTWAGGVGNVIIGYVAGMGSTPEATYNTSTIVGYSAGAVNKGGDNTFLGAYSGISNTTGTKNLFLGIDSGYRQTTLSNLLIVSTQRFADVATELTNSILYGVMAATPAAQTLRINADVGINVTPTANMVGLAIEGGLLTLKETTTPTADTNYGKIYTKTDNKLYFQDGAGTEHEIAFV